MPADSNLILTRNVFLSNLTDMRDGVPLNFTTPSVNIGQVAVDGNLVARIFIPAFTNRNPGSGVGAYTRPTMSAVVQVAEGSPAVAGNWKDLMWFKQIRPQVFSGDGSGTPSNMLFSREYIVRFNTDKSNVRISGQYIGSFPDFSAVQMDIHAGIRRPRELD